MGPVGESNLKTAPVFFYSQVDMKIWLVVLCFTVTSTVDFRVMEDYTADAFLSGFVRFACRFGYPNILMPD